ncbi:GMC oxidoreductase-domain-containing protein [Coprinopsis sp. MPI-PUGE-AT-0042]|nr:GMC oxidoreductase-domain-containing protein [Coprinopsis sp. MPI-PUGE-AT-0042]
MSPTQDLNVVRSSLVDRATLTVPGTSLWILQVTIDPMPVAGRAVNSRSWCNAVRVGVTGRPGCPILDVELVVRRNVLLVYVTKPVHASEIVGVRSSRTASQMSERYSILCKSCQWWSCFLKRDLPKRDGVQKTYGIFESPEVTCQQKSEKLLLARALKWREMVHEFNRHSICIPGCHEAFLWYSALRAPPPLLSGAVIVDDFDALPATEYDLIIVGGIRESSAQDLAHRSRAQCSSSPLLELDVNIQPAALVAKAVLDLTVPAYVTRRFGGRVRLGIQDRSTTWLEQQDRRGIQGATCSVVAVRQDGLGTTSALLPEGWEQMSVANGTRSSSAFTYLASQYASRANLHVRGKSSGYETASDGRVALGRSSYPRFPYRSYGTPQLLLLSGIGDATELEDAGIQPTVDLSSVGKNLTEHPLVNIIWNHGAQHEDPSSGSNSPHFEIMTYGLGGAYPLPGPTITSALILLTPTSRGTLTLNASDPLGDPLIDLGMLTSDFDIRALHQGIAGVLSLRDPLSEATSDDQVGKAIRDLAGNAYHPVSTAMMTPEDASYGVVNPDLRVKKVSGLRIVDASIMPHIPTGHTQAPVYAIAERAADMVKAHWAA